MYAAVSEAAAEPGRRICVSRMLERLGVSKSGYYDWLHREPSQRSIKKANVIEKIKAIYEESKCIYGAPKITHKLRESGFDGRLDFLELKKVEKVLKKVLTLPAIRL